MIHVTHRHKMKKEKNDTRMLPYSCSTINDVHVRSQLDLSVHTEIKCLHVVDINIPTLT